MAMPEAYEQMINPADGKRIETAIQDAVSVALKKHGECDGFFLQNCTLAIKTWWAKSSGEDSIVLIYSLRELPKFNLFDADEFNQAVREAIPIPFV